MDVFQLKVQESAVVQSTKLDVSGIFTLHWNRREASSSASEGVTCQRGKNKQAETENFSLSRPFIGCQREVWPRLEVGLHQKIWIKGVPSPFQII